MCGCGSCEAPQVTAVESREPALNVALIAHAAQEFPGIGTTATDLTGSAEVLLSSEGYHNLSPTISSLRTITLRI